MMPRVKSSFLRRSGVRNALRKAESKVLPPAHGGRRLLRPAGVVPGVELDQLAEQIDERDRELDRLRGLVDHPDGAGQPEADSPAEPADPAEPAGADEPAEGALAEEGRHG